MKISILGAGSWGTAIANTVAQNTSRVILCGRKDHIIDSINNDRVSEYLPSIELSKNIVATTDLAYAVNDTDFLFIAIPSGAIRELCMNIKNLAIKGAIVVCSKGMEKTTNLLPGEIVADVLGKDIEQAALCGPNLALEVASFVPSTTTVASKNKELFQKIASFMNTTTFSCYFSPHLKSTQFYGVAKNVTAIACGLVSALEIGFNTVSSVVNCGIIDTINLCKANSMISDDFSIAPAGIGDMYLACASKKSRNYWLGNMIGSGSNPAELLNSSVVYEGANSVKSVVELSKKLNINTPLFDIVYRIINSNSIDKDSLKAEFISLLSKYN